MDVVILDPEVQRQVVEGFQKVIQPVINNAVQKVQEENQKELKKSQF
jgi:hypothetical protein